MPSEFFTGKQYHIGAGPGDLAPYILLCGDPERAKKTAELFDANSIRFSGNHREFITFTGKFKGTEITVMATGIGPDNTEIAVIESSRCVAHPTFIRIGSCGAIADGILIRDLVISRRAIPREDTSSFYLPRGTPVAGDPDVISALETAAQKLGHPYHMGTACSTSSFYGGQCREVPGFPIQEYAKAEHVFPKLLAQGVKIFEMETSLLYTLATISTLGIRAGSVCAVYDERGSKQGFEPEMLVEAERRCIETGLEAVRILAARER